MFSETVDVTEVIGNKVKVQFAKKEMCSCCKYTSLCGISTKDSNRSEEITLHNTGELNLQKGDKILVGIEEKKTLFASLLLFICPAVVFILLLVLLRPLKEHLSFFLAIFGVSVYYVAVKMVVSKRKEYFNLKILEKL